MIAPGVGGAAHRAAVGHRPAIAPLFLFATVLPGTELFDITGDPAASYTFTREYEILEFNLAGIASHAEMAQLMTPRPFMVERGHRDAVGIDEWVAYEYAKVFRYYDQQQLRDRTEIAYFDGPHRIDGTATIEFLHRFLSRRLSDLKWMSFCREAVKCVCSVA